MNAPHVNPYPHCWLCFRYNGVSLTDHGYVCDVCYDKRYRR